MGFPIREIAAVTGHHLGVGASTSPSPTTQAVLTAAVYSAMTTALIVWKVRRRRRHASRVQRVELATGGWIDLNRCRQLWSDAGRVRSRLFPGLYQRIYRTQSQTLVLRCFDTATRDNPLGAMYVEVDELEAAAWLICEGKVRVAARLFPGAFAQARTPTEEGQR